MKPAVAFIWSNFGPYHIDRLEAAANALKESHRVVGIEVAGSTVHYPWNRTDNIKDFHCITLFPKQNFESISKWRQLRSLIRICFKIGATDIFVCNYNRLDIFPLAWILRLSGRRVHCMIESKFDDRERRFLNEIAKRVFFSPYCSALVGGQRSRDYVAYFGLRHKRIEFGYDSISGRRIRELAGSPPAPEGVPFKDRHFTIVARLVPKKNVAMAIEAYAQYRANARSAARDLHICGSGKLEDELRHKVAELQLDGVIFHGFVQSPEVARTLASTLALILPSNEDQWGLVVNEAVSMGVPILCSMNVGARDLLVKTAVNGYVFEPDNPEGLAQLMGLLTSDEAEWRRMAAASLKFAPIADSEQFGIGVSAIVRNSDR